MAYCQDCAKLEDAAEAATLEYEELVVQNAANDAAAKAREKRDQLRRQLNEHKAAVHPATSSAGSAGGA